MKTPKGREGRLTEFVMQAVSENLELEPPLYNRIFEAVHVGLKNCEEIQLAIVPDNDYAFMARFMALRPEVKKMIRKMAEDLMP